MPRFYFHLRNGGVIHDDAGEELPNIKTARRKARLVALELAEALDNGEEVAVVVSDGKNPVLEVAVTERLPS
jgi:uncharacterized protein DUF6894